MFTEAPWPTKRLKFCVSYNDEVLPESTDDFETIEYVEISDVSLVDGVERSTPMLFHEAPSRARRRVRAGDILVSTVRTYLKAIAAVGEAPENLIASTGFCVIRPKDGVDPHYAGWVAKSEEFVGEVVARSVGVSYPAINASQLVDIAVPFPPIDIQQRIASFLNEKTAQIDALIEKKQALLERLAEKRQAIITQAVTKGLNPSAPMRDSGIDWLGQIPAHWEVKPLKRVKKYLTSGSRDWADYYADEGEIFLRMTNVTKRGIEIDPTDIRRVQLRGVFEGTRTATKAGDILITITAELGSVAIVRDAHEGAYINQHLALFRSDQAKCDPSFLVNFLWSEVTKAQFILSGQGGTKQGLGFDQVDGVIVVLPPLHEQQEIAKQAQFHRTYLDAAESAIERSIVRLSEYRTSLITAALTGQIEGLQ